MTIETDLVATLSPLTGNRVSPDEFPQTKSGAPPTWPAIRYTVISWVPYVDVCGDGDDETAEPRIQLDVVAETRKAANTLRSSVIAAMQSFDPPAILIDRGRSSWDQETQTYRWILEYSFHGSTQQ